jgi:hypothetical protein
MKQLIVFLFIAGCFIISCKKDSFITSSNAALHTSDDTLHFDTVFTSVGSITGFFRIYNDNNQKLRLDKVSLGGGAGSFFKMNVDGTAGSEVDDIEIAANDSIYVFVSVKIDPNAANLPFVVQDSVNIQYNGNHKWVQLEAWGQNANFINSALITGNQVWTNTKPYVILGGVQIDTTATLTIQAGTKIYLHADAPIIVDGTLIVNGQKYDSTKVVFRGDRLDDPYRDFPAGWPGIIFRGQSKDNLMQFAEIRNAYQGIIADEPSINANPKVILNQCLIDNCYDAGIIGLHSSLKAQNVLVSNCGKNVEIAYGGNYNFTHCTVVAYSNLFMTHKDPILLLTDYIKQSDNSIVTANLNAAFTNCILWGDNGTVDNEVVTDKQGTSFSVNFQNCLWKVKTNPANITSSGIIANQDPLFDSVNNQKPFYSFRLQANSPALNKGVATSVVIDLDGNPRPVGLPDFGCYEKQ